MSDDAEDPDGFDEARRREIALALAAVQAMHDRDRRIATMTPLEIAEDDLAVIIEFGRQYEAGETTIPVTEANMRNLDQLIAEKRAEIDRLSRS